MTDSVLTRFYRLLPEATDDDMIAMRALLSTIIRAGRKLPIQQDTSEQVSSIMPKKSLSETK